jgi:signal transduction histidine kinase
MLLLVGAQRRRLARQLLAQRRIAVENKALRSAADKARLEASHANEQLLNHVGAELHDGPIQTLSLAMLLADGTGQGPAPSSKALVAQAMAEMRAISSGLILPELEGLTLAETILLAIDRHENLTGTRVERAVGALPADISHPLKVCAYRLVQEGLNNAFRHAGGLGQQVAAQALSETILIEVRDRGIGHPLPLASRKDLSGLGLQGIRHRLAAHGGHLDLHVDPNSGTALRAMLPAHPHMTAGPPASDQR